MTSSEKLTCVKCGKTKNETEFFKMRTGERCDMCKSCLTMHIDNRDPSTFMWILEKFDIPYIEQEWIKITNRQYQKNPSKFGPASVLGFYMRNMQMTQWKEYTFKDSDALNFKNEKEQKSEEERIQEQLRNEQLLADLTERYENGEISKAEFDTLNPLNYEEEKIEFIQPTGIDENAIASQLSEEDMQYLSLKWGNNYRPSEWVQMEELYTKYENEYELNTDRADTLKKICKTSLKMDQSLDVNDISGVKSLASVLDTLRKSGKFTEAQNKEEQNVRYLDSIGELVAFCEREGGIIDCLPDPDEYPQDKIDITIKDLQAYTYNLAVRELGLGDLIESYIKKLEEAESNDSVDPMQGLITSEEEAEEDILTDEEAYKFQEYLDNEIEKDAEELLKSIGDL